MLIWILSNIKKTEKVNPNDEKLAGKKSRVWALSGFIMVPQGLLLLAKGSSSRLSGCNLTPRPVPLQGCPTKTAFPASWKKKKPSQLLTLGITDFRTGQRVEEPTARAPEGPNQDQYQRILELCQNQLPFSTSIFIQPSSNSSLASPGWVRKKQLYVLAAGANSHFQPWRDRAAASHHKHLKAACFSLPNGIPSAASEGLSCWLLSNTLHSYAHDIGFFWAPSSWHTVQWRIVKVQMYQIFW